MTRIEDLDHLKKMAEKEPLECFIKLNFGARSSKRISYSSEEEKPFYIYHEIDGSEEKLKETELLTESNIGHALSLGALYAY